MTRSAILLNPKLKPQQETEMHKLKTRFSADCSFKNIRNKLLRCEIVHQTSDF